MEQTPYRPTEGQARTALPYSGCAPDAAFRHSAAASGSHVHLRHPLAAADNLQTQPNPLSTTPHPRVAPCRPFSLLLLHVCYLFSLASVFQTAVGGPQVPQQATAEQLPEGKNLHVSMAPGEIVRRSAAGVPSPPSTPCPPYPPQTTPPPPTP
jgi:hypothetical protein